MAKKIIKEIIIFLLFTLAIILVLGVLLYEYVPSNKIIPEKISYTTPEKVKTELQTVVDESKDEEEEEKELYIDYHIDSTQINNYQKIQEYVPGRKNPFAAVEKTENTESTDNTTNSASNGQQNSSTSNTGSTTSQENTGYLPNKGTK